MTRQGPQLITDARPSADAQLRSRQRRYLTMMAVRVVCLIVGAVLAGADVPLLWLWLSVCAVAAVLLPWLAVLIANDGPPRQQHRPRRTTVRERGPAQVASHAGPGVIDHDG